MSGFGINLGEARRREEAAKRRGERFKVSDDVREARAAVLEQRDALREKQEAEAKAEREASPDALRALLSRGTVDELAEVARMIGRLDGRRLQILLDDVFREKSRTGHTPEPFQAPSDMPSPPRHDASAGADDGVALGNDDAVGARRRGR